MYTRMILDNAINRGRPLINTEELNQLAASGESYTVTDARVPKQYETAHIPGAEKIPHESIRINVEGIDKNATYVTYCNKGATGKAIQNTLLNRGFQKVFNLSGGVKQYKACNLKQK